MIFRTKRTRVLPALLLAAGCCIAQARAEDLMQLYIMAQENDPDFQRARIERQASLESVKESRAGLGPSVSANAESSKIFQEITQSDNPFFFQVGRTDYANTSYSVSLTQPLYHRDLFARMPQARAEARKTEALLRVAEEDLLFRVAQSHFQFLAARESLDFASAERQANSGQLQEARERLQSGLGTITDVHDLEGREAVSEAAEAEAEDALEQARRAIAEITGSAPDDLARLSDAFPFGPPEEEDVEKWVATALFRNPRIEAVQADIDAAEEERGRQQGLYLPGFDFFASYTASDNGGTVYGGGNRIYSREAGVRLTLPIYDGGRAIARIKQADLRRNAAYQELEKERRQAEREARAAFQGVVSGLKRVQALSKSVFAHEAALAVKEEGWRSGINTGLIVLDARKELFQARRDLAHARYLYVLQGLKLKQAAGVLEIEDLRKLNAYLQ